MRSLSLWVRAAVCVAICVSASSLRADVIEGEVESVSISRNRQTITVLVGENRKKETFLVSVRTTSILVDGRNAKLEDVKPGQKITVTTATGTRAVKLQVGEAPPAGAIPEGSEGGIVNSTSLWPQFMGPARNGHSQETNLNFNWGANGPAPLWSQSGLGEGYSAVSIADGKLFTLGTQGNNEAVFAMDLASGRPLWSVPIGNIFQDGAGNGPRGTPTIDGDRLYALGGHGDLVCVDHTTGRQVWSKNILREFKGNNITWGICESPLIHGDKLICTPGGDGATMVALKKTDGSLIWKSAVPGNPATAYASAIVIDVDGVTQYVNFTHSKLIGVRADDGQFLWENSSACNGTANCSTALYDNGLLFYSSGYSTGGVCLELKSSGNTTTARELYKTRDMQSHHGGMVIVDGHLYGSSEAIFRCLELRTGNVKWESRNPGKGSITYADGHLIARSEQGPITLIEATPAAYRQKARFEQPQQLRTGRQAWAYPVVADGKLFLRDQQHVLCYDLKN